VSGVSILKYGKAVKGVRKIESADGSGLKREK
jgi:hypothetical protein